MEESKLYLGNCLDVLLTLKDHSVNMIFADPPYNMQLSKDLYRPDSSKVEGVKDFVWDHFESFKEYDNTTIAWLTELKRVLKPDGTLWIIGSYHNIFRIGKILQDLGFWILNDIIWQKSNPMPNFKGVRFTNAHETLLWVAPKAKAKYYFNYRSMKIYNDDKQMNSIWNIPLCSGNERIKINGKVAHPTQKPLQLLIRILLASTKENAIVLDPFMGTGTTMAAAKILGRRYIGIEQEENYYNIAKERLQKVEPISLDYIQIQSKTNSPRVPIASLLDANMLEVGSIFFDKSKTYKATLRRDGSLLLPDNFSGSIHQSATHLKGKSINGWDFWHVVIDESFIMIDDIRQKYIKKYL